MLVNIPVHDNQPIIHPYLSSVQFSSVQSLSCVRLFATPWIAVRQASPSITSSQSSLRLTFIEPVMPSSHLILCCPLLLLPPIPPSISLFQWVNPSHEVAKVLEFQLQDHSFQRNPRADLLQNELVGPPCSPRTLKSLLQHHSSKASIPTVIKRVIPFRFYIFTTFLCFTLEILWKGHQNIYCIFAKKQNWLRKQHSNHNTGTVILSWTIKISGLCDFVVYIKKKWLFVIIQFLTGCSYNTWNFLRDESNKGIFPYVNEKIW